MNLPGRAAGRLPQPITVCVFNLTAKAVSDKSCSLPVEEAGILWDSICFFFLLLQRRVFLSFYFLHVVAELQASAKQASR